MLIIMQNGALHQLDLLSGRTYVITGPIGVICHLCMLEYVRQALVQRALHN